MVGLAAVLSASCSGEDCDCSPTGMRVELRNPSVMVTGAQVSGSACEDAKIGCGETLAVNGACTFEDTQQRYFIVEPKRAGTCTIAFDTEQGPMRFEAKFRQTYGCCAGVRLDNDIIDTLHDAGIEGYPDAG